jgi:hypothetical protein
VVTEWLKDMLNHNLSFLMPRPHTRRHNVLNQRLIDDIAQTKRPPPRLQTFIPSMGMHCNSADARKAFLLYDEKYAGISKRKHLPPLSVKCHLKCDAGYPGSKLISFDGDQTL